jgi:hypothetical protein
MKCPNCRVNLTDDEGSSWPYCPICNWDPDCDPDEVDRRLSNEAD